MRHLFKLIFLLFVSVTCEAVTKVACIGASITYGATIPDREKYSFPAQLQTLLGNNFQVDNYGVSGTTLLKNGNLPYINTPQYQAALKSDPDIVFIDLGGNDSKMINRTRLNEYEQDYHELIRSFAALPSKPRIIIMLPMVSFVKDTTGIWDPVIVSRIIPMAQKVAFDCGVEVLDIHQLLINKPELVPDQIHPNAEGSAIISRRMYEMLKQNRDLAFDVFKKIDAVKEINSFYGYECASFTFDGRSCKIVKPKWSAKGHPYIWRARFWGHEPQTDIALLERGFHVVYCDVAELFGNSKAVEHWNNFYKLLKMAGLSKKAALEGMSRGAVYVYNWAAVNPGKISCIYVDNPVLDLKTWPGSKENAILYKKEHGQFMEDYGLVNEIQVNQFKGSPIDKVKEIVKGGYPSLILCADADEAVPPETNTLLFEKMINSLNGNITVFHKLGFKHHPHSLPNPAMIIDFILKASKH